MGGGLATRRRASALPSSAVNNLSPPALTLRVRSGQTQREFCAVLRAGRRSVGLAGRSVSVASRRARRERTPHLARLKMPHPHRRHPQSRLLAESVIRREYTHCPAGAIMVYRSPERDLFHEQASLSCRYLD